MTIELKGEKKRASRVPEEFLEFGQGFPVDLAAYGLPLPLAGDEPRILEFLEVMRHRGPRDFEDAAGPGEGAEDALATIVLLPFRLEDHEEDLEALFAGERLEVTDDIRQFHDHRIINFRKAVKPYPP